jgi:hypothetical protein
MRKALFFVSILGIVVATSAFGQNYRGTYTTTSGGVTLTLVLEQDAAGRISGTLSSTKGTRFRLEGKIQEGIAIGNCLGESGQSYFEAEFEDTKLVFTLVEVKAAGEGTSRSLEFVRSSGGGTKAAPQVPSAPAPRSESAPKSPPPQAPAPAPAPKIPDSGKRVSDPQMGISFVPPAGWIAQKQGEVFLLGSNTYKGFILIQPHSFLDLRQMAEEAGQGIVEEDSGIRLTPTSKFQAVGSNGLSGDFEGIVQGRQARAFAIGLVSPKGGGVTILAAVESGSYTKDYPGFVRSIASGLKFAEAGPSDPTGTSGPSDASLMKYFAGEYYSYSSGSTLSGSAGTQRTVTLCPDGIYRDSYEFSASGSDWGGANSQRGAARWSIQGDKSRGVIVIAYANGQTKRFSYQVASKDEGTILFDGVRFAYAGASKCR